MLQELKERRKEQALNKLKDDKFYNSELKMSDEDIKKVLKFGELNPIIFDFVKKYNENFGDYNFRLFTNLHDLHIYINHYDENAPQGYFQNNKLYLSTRYGEDYDPHDKTILHTLYRELLHVATFDPKKKGNNYGFCKQVGRINFAGQTLDDGYTELLTNRYFSDVKIPGFYKITKYAENVERLVGKHKMQEAYFTGDLYSIQEGLGEYLEDPLNFIIDVDKGLIDPNEVLDGIKEQKLKKIKR